MKNKKLKWVIFTVLMGLMPIICKLLIVAFLKERQWNAVFNELDFATFGLVLSISNLNELNGKNGTTQVQESWHTWSVGISIFLIVFFAIIFSISALVDLNESNNLFDRASLKVGSVFLAVCSFVFSYALFTKINPQ